MSARMGEIVKRTDALFLVDAITGLGTMPLDIDGWGLDIVRRRIAEGIHDSARHGVHVDQPEGLGRGGIVQAAQALLQSEEREEERRQRRIEPGRRTRRWCWHWREALKYIKSLGMDKLIANAQLLAMATREAVTDARAGTVRAKSPAASSVTAVSAPRGHGFRRDREGVPRAASARSSPMAKDR